MSFHYLQELEAGCSQASYAGSEPSVPLKSTSSDVAESCNVSQKDSSKDFLSGTTLKHSTGNLGVDGFISSLEEIPASETATLIDTESLLNHLAHNSYALSEKYDRGLLSGKTLPKSEQTRHGQQIGSLMGFDLWVTSRSLSRFGRAVWELTTNEPGCSCSVNYPTPAKSQAIQGQNDPDGKRGQTLIGAARGQEWPRSKKSRILPTPRAADARRHGCDNGRSSRGAGGPDLQTAVIQEMLPTPASRDWRSGKASQKTLFKNSRPLNEVIVAKAGGKGSVLHPDFVEWMMGWPIGWSASKPLGTDKFQQWCEQHGCS